MGLTKQLKNLTKKNSKVSQKTKNKTKQTQTNSYLLLSILPGLAINRRVFFLTDMRMTAGNSGHLLKRMNEVATHSDPIHTTIIGFGFELDTDLCSTLSSVPFCNFFSVHSASEFLHQMTWEFDYLVFPIAKDLIVSVEGEAGGVKVEKVCGSPESLEGYPEGTLMACSGMFASQTQGKDQGATKGGVVVVKLKLDNPEKPLKLRTRFETFEKKVVEVEHEVVFPKWEGKEKEGEGGKWGSFGGEGVRKGVLVCRFVEFMKRFLEDMQNSSETATISKSSGVVWTSKDGGKQCRGGEGSAECLKEYRERMLEFLDYYKSEAALLDDTELGIWKAKMEQVLPEEKK